MDSYVELLIQNEEIVYQPVIEGEIIWETERKGTPGKLTFNVLKDGIINFQEGNRVTFTYNGEKYFMVLFLINREIKAPLLKLLHMISLGILRIKKHMYIKTRLLVHCLKRFVMSLG